MENPYNKENPMWFCQCLNDGFGCNDNYTTCKECLEELNKDIKKYLSENKNAINRRKKPR